MVPISSYSRNFLMFFVLLLFCSLSHANGFPVDFSKNKHRRTIGENGSFYEGLRLNPHSRVAATAFYIKANATGSNDGTSWQNAYTNLTYALLYCAAGDTIRVAQGTYVPTGASFSLRDYVVMLGGYPNTGNPADTERNFATHPTILSGETGNPLFPFDNLSTILTGNLLHSGMVLDGFIIEKGYSNNTTQGVGINLWRSSPTIKNCVFRNNSSYNSSIGGSSIACQNNSNPTLINCFFLNNLDFGFGTVFIKSNCKPQLVNCVFSGNDGRFVIYTNQSTLSVTNCTFTNNQIGNSVLPRDVNAGFIYAETGAVLTVANTIFYNNKYKLSTDTADISLNASSLTITNSITQNYPAGNSYLTGMNPLFRNITNIAGPDNFYFTADDGLKPERCSPAINAGNNAADSAIFTDILQLTRIYNGKADIGAYEYQAGNGDDILETANDSIVANREFTDQTGWTHYYKDCQLLLSVKKNGQQIGTVNDGTFKVSIKTTAGYGSAKGNNLSQAAYVAPAVYWSALNRFWTINATKQPVDSVLIRVPWSGKDFNDAKGINPAITALGQLVFYMVDSPFMPLSTAATMNDFHPYYQTGTATTTSWKYGSIDSVNYAEFYVKKIYSGGIGTGTGLNNGPLALPNNECQGGDKIYASTLTGSAFQWQVDEGNGFVNIWDAAAYSGTNTFLLRVIAPPTSSYGHKFRCMVTEANSAAFTPEIMLKFVAHWKGTASTAWNLAANWSCGIVPDEHTDVLIKGGTQFNPFVNADISCRHLYLTDNALLTVMAGKQLLITGKE